MLKVMAAVLVAGGLIVAGVINDAERKHAADPWAESVAALPMPSKPVASAVPVAAAQPVHVETKAEVKKRLAEAKADVKVRAIQAKENKARDLAVVASEIETRFLRAGITASTRVVGTKLVINSGACGPVLWQRLQDDGTNGALALHGFTKVHCVAYADEYASATSDWDL